jgi:hypothetical protein
VSRRRRVGWFAANELPPADLLAPPDRFPSVLDAWRIARTNGIVPTALLDRPKRI